MTEKQQLPYQRGLYFEAYAVGHYIESAGRTVTETDVVQFAGLSGDWNPIHVNAEFAGQSYFGQRVAHGLLGLAIAQGLAVRLGFLDDTLLAFREIDGWKFSLPIFIGDTLRVRLTVTETRLVRRLSAGMVFLQVELLNQKEQVVQQGVWQVLIKSQAPGE